MTFQEVWAELEAKDESFKRAREIAELGVEQLEYAYNQGYKRGKSERPTGKWRIEESSETGALGIKYTLVRCSQCGWDNSLAIPRNFCPNCGAKMYKEDN